MTKSNDPAESQLRSLERWRTSVLEQAQAKHARTLKIADQRQQTVKQVQEVIDDSHSLARSHMSPGSTLSIDALTRIRHFAVLRSDDLQQARASLALSKQEAARAHAEVCKRFEEVTVVERLRGRRTEEVSKELLRLEQKRLDEQAALRASQLSRIGIRKINE
jgi:flagellar export protein FliJ